MAYQRHNIVNGQYVHIEQTPASIGHRILAQLIDIILLVLYYNAAAMIIVAIPTDESWGAFILWVFYLLPTLYPPLCEQLFNGVTIGKRAMNIRVVMQNGQPVSIGASILRAMMMIFDAGFLYAGLLVMFCNKKNMRLGDLASGTIVISESQSSKQKKAMNALKRFTFIRNDYQPTYPFAAELTWGQINLINHTILQKGTHRYAPNQKKNIEKLARKIAEKYNVTGLTGVKHNDFLHTIVADYNYYTWNDTV